MTQLVLPAYTFTVVYSSVMVSQEKVDVSEEISLFGTHLLLRLQNRQTLPSE